MQIPIVFFALAVFYSCAAIAGERIVYGISTRIASLNPYMLTGIDTFRVTGFVIEPLARIEPFSQELKPWLAESWTIDQKSKIIKIKLRKNVKFHNGEPFTAEDVKFTWSSYNDPAYQGTIWKAMWADVTDIKIIDPHSVEFQLKDLNFQTFRNVLTALRILPKSYYGKVNHGAWVVNLVGSGPFKVERFESNQTLHLVANKDWWGWGTLKPPEGLTVKSIPDAKFAEQLLAKKELDVFEVPSGVPPPEGVEWLTSAFGRGFSVAFNFRRKEMQNQELRKALIRSWNRTALSEKIFNNRLKPALDSFSPTTSYYPKATPEKHSTEKAGETIKKLGYTPEKPLTLKILGGQPGSDRWIGLFQTDAAKAGIKIEIENVADENQWWHLVQQGKTDLVAYDGAFSEIPHPSVYHSKGAYNSSGIQDPRLDRLLDQLQGEFDVQKRRKIQRDLITYLRSITAEIPGLVTDQTPFLLSPDVTVDRRAPLEPWRWRKKLRQ